MEHFCQNACSCRYRLWWFGNGDGANECTGAAALALICLGLAIVLFVVHALDKKDIPATRAKHYRAHRIHLDQAEEHAVEVVTADVLVADDGETLIGSIFIVDAAYRPAVEAFTRSDPYHVNGVWDWVAIHRLHGSAVNNPVPRRVEGRRSQPESLAPARPRNKH
jgi:uncharacterized protein YciI